MGDIINLYEMHIDLLNKHNSLVQHLIDKGIIKEEKTEEVKNEKKKKG